MRTNEEALAPATLPAAMTLKRCQEELVAWVRNVTVEDLACETPLFPNSQSLSRLDEIVSTVGRLLGVKKVHGLHRWGLFKRVDRRFPKLGLTQAVTGLVNRLDRLSPPPSTAVYNALRAERQKARKLIAALDRLFRMSADDPELATIKWESELPVWLLRHTTKGFRSRFDERFPEVWTDHPSARFLGLAIFLDLHRQELLWKTECSFAASFVQWASLLHNDRFIPHLRRLTINPLPPVAEGQTKRRRILHRRRQQKLRRKSKISG
jgi:hypothetical protein